MSARAAWRLETLGFRHVYRYQAGKDDWWVARLPMAGAKADVRSAAEAARRNVPTCGLHDRVDEVAEQVRLGNWPLAVVLNEQRIVLGRLRPRDIDAHPNAIAEHIMLDGPRTIRGTRAASEMAQWLDERHLPGVLITTADGELVGYLRREDVYSDPPRGTSPRRASRCALEAPGGAPGSTPANAFDRFESRDGPRLKGAPRLR